MRKMFCLQKPVPVHDYNCIPEVAKEGNACFQDFQKARPWAARSPKAVTSDRFP